MHAGSGHSYHQIVPENSMLFEDKSHTKHVIGFRCNNLNYDKNIKPSAAMKAQNSHDKDHT